MRGVQQSGAQRAGLQTGDVTSTTTVYEHVSQAGTSDWDLMLLTPVLDVTEVGSGFVGSLTYHPTCHGLRGLGLGERPQRCRRQVVTSPTSWRGCTCSSPRTGAWPIVYPPDVDPQTVILVARTPP